MSRLRPHADPEKGSMKKPKPSRKVKRDRDGLTRCRVCGCTELDACNPPCGWEPGHEDLCTTCNAAAKAIVQWLWAARRANKAALWREVERYQLPRS